MYIPLSVCVFLGNELYRMCKMSNPWNHGPIGGLEIFPTMNYIFWSSVTSPAAAGNPYFDSDVKLSENAVNNLDVMPN